MPRITLEYPIQSPQRGEIKEIDIRRPTVGDHLRAAGLKNKSESEREVWMVQTLTELTPDELELMDLADYMACMETLEGFLASKKRLSGER